jgi:predicted transcriptional regulator
MSMSDKEFALDSVSRLPADATLDTIAEQLGFLAAIREGSEEIKLDEVTPHEEVKRQLAEWLRIPNKLTARTLDASRRGKGVKRFSSKKKLTADLGL